MIFLFWHTKNYFLLVLPFKEISLWPELSSPTRFRIQGKVHWVLGRTDGGRKFLCLTFYCLCRASVTALDTWSDVNSGFFYLYLLTEDKTVFFLSVSQWVVLKDSLLHWFQWNNNLEICLPLTHICFSGFLWYNFSISWVKKLWTPWPWLKSAVYFFSVIFNQYNGRHWS